MDDRIATQGWAVGDSYQVGDYLRQQVHQTTTELARMATNPQANEDDMKAVYSALVDLHEMLGELPRSEMWRISICDFANSGLNIEQLEVKE